MNNQPPYGDPSAWNQQGNPGNPAQYPVQPNPYQQGYYPQAEPNPYQQPVQGYQQPQQMQPPVQQGYQPYQQAPVYGQQQHPQQPVYQQQTWQPYVGQPQQTYQQPYQQGPVPQQFYGQQNAGQQPQYPQFNQMGQMQGYGYSGYHSQPSEKKFEIPFDVIGKVILFGVLPVLFILAMIFGAPALKWVFLAGAVGGIILMWMRDIVSPNMRLTMSLVLGVMAVVALVGALSGAPQDKTNTPVNNNPISMNGPGGTVNPTVPQTEPTATPAPEDEADSAVEQLMSFFWFWYQGNDEEMVSLTAPSWRATVENPKEALFTLLFNRTPLDDYEVTQITGTPNDAMRTVTVKVTIDKNDNRATKDRYAFKVIMKKEDDVWYVDPQSLQSNDKVTATETVASSNTTPTQPPLYTGTPSTVLYYNAKGGGVRYHLDPDCRDVGDRYKPMDSFMYTDLDKAPYNELRPCNACGAPIPDDY